MTTTGRGLAVTSPQLIFTENGKHVYAYSGQIQYTNTETTFIEGTTQEGIADVFIQYSTLAYSADDPTVKV